MVGNLAYTGVQRSYSFACIDSGRADTSLTSTLCPSIACEWVMFQNDPESTGNVFVGSERLSVVGNGIELTPGSNSGWLPVNDLGLFYHKESDATTYLNYLIIGCRSNLNVPPPVIGYLQQENSDYLLQEDGDKILL